MNLQQLRYAKALAECGSFVQAANQCAVTQPTLSNAIAQLESELGHQLFARTTRTVRLTEAGEYLLNGIADVLRAQAALLAQARALAHPEKKLLRVGVSPVIGVKFVDLVIEPFRHENHDIEVIFRELNLAEMIALLKAGQLDFVFGPVEATPTSLPGFGSALFHEEPLVFVPSAKSNYARTKSVTLKDIADETFVMVPDACGLTQTTRAVFKRRRVKLNEYRGQAMSYGVLQEWAELGIGSAILPRSKLRAGRGQEITISDGGDALQIHYRALWRRDSSTPPAVKHLASFLRDVAPSIIQGLA
ncbi:LysR family transcriptional regulator [Roseiterribacter gracilis]|uniref:LysR family transcriptional regulator n=1 Tax=Roseiterribacter gracilis TaxID=2812848 RepID=A0A8S8X906_9PROT|nr:LysR family transcriptional regulator [Rhodospirillales bacterium TMPK1]